MPASVYVMRLLRTYFLLKLLLHTNNREQMLEQEHLLWLRIALQLQLRPTNFCQWHLGLRFCGCSHMGILGSFQLGVGSAFLCVCGSACAECAERGFRLVTSQINKHPKKYPHLNCSFALVKRKVAFFYRGVVIRWVFQISFVSLHQPHTGPYQ